MALTRITKGVIKPNENYDTHNINSTGIVTAIGLDVNGNGDISGNLSVGGVLTYEDVTSIASVGIITARNGIDCNGDIDVDGHTNLDNVSIAGITTFASSIYVADSIIHEGDTDTKIDFTTNVIKLTAANRLRIDFQSNGYNRFYGSQHSEATSSYPKGTSATYVHRFRDTEGDDTEVQFFNTNVKNTILSWNDYGNSTSAGNLVFKGVVGGSGVEHARFTGSGNFNLLRDLDVDGHTNLDNVSIAGVSTVTTFLQVLGQAGTSDKGFEVRANSTQNTDTNKAIRIRNNSNTDTFNISYKGKVTATELDISGNIDVDGHTNLDNVNIAGVTSCANSIHLNQAVPEIRFNSTTHENDFKIINYQGNFIVQDIDALANRFEIASNGTVNFLNNVNANGGLDVTGNTTVTGDIDVDGHTNLDNVSITGVTTTTETIRIGANNKYLKLGASDQLSLVALGGQSYITNSTGHLTGRSASYTWENLAGNTEYLRIDSGGRLLIGTTGHQSVYSTTALQIAGTSAATSSLSLLRHGNSPYLILGSSGGNALQSVTALSDNDRIGQITFAGADGTDINTHSASIAAFVDGSVSSNTVPGRLTFQTSTGASELERMAILSDGKIAMGLRSTSASNTCDPDGNQLLIRGATTVGTNKGHIMLTGDGATNGEGPQIVFSESGSGSNFAGAYIGHIRAGSNSLGHLVFGTRETGGDINTVPTERLRIQHDGRVFVNSTAVVNTDDFLTIKRPAGNNAVTSITVDANNHTGSYANALIFTKAKDYYYNGIIFTSSSGHQGGICGKMSVAGGTAPQIDFRIGGTSFNQSDKLAMTIYNNADIQMHGSSSKDLKWDESEASLYLTDAGSGASAKLKIGTGGDLQLYHDVGGANHIVAANNQEIKISANTHTFYDYTGVTKRLEIDDAARLRTRGATNIGHGGMVYIQGYSDPIADETHSNLTVRGEGGNGFACGTYEGTANYASWIQAGYVQNFTGGSPAAIYPLVLQPNGAPVCIGNYSDASTDDGGLLRIQTKDGATKVWHDYGLTLEHIDGSNARHQKWAFINASNQGTTAHSNSKFRHHAVPYTSNSTNQVWTDQINYAHVVGYNQYSWYKFNVHATSSSRGGSCRIAITWTSRHAGPAAYGEYSFAWYDEHHTSRIQLIAIKEHFLHYGGGSYYGWNSTPDVTVYSSTGGGSAGGFYLRVEGHVDANSSTYDGGIIHHFNITHNDNNCGGNNSYFEFVSNASGGPSQASQVQNFN